MASNGQPLLHIDKGFGKRRKVRVSTPGGPEIGAIRWLGGSRQALLDPNGVQLCLLGDVAHVQVHNLVKRNGRRVRGKGTSHVGGGGGGMDWPV